MKKTWAILVFLLMTLAVFAKESQQNKKYTLFEYIAWRGDLTFEEVPLNELDSVIFALLSYVDFDGVIPNDGEISLHEAAHRYFAAENRYSNPDKDWGIWQNCMQTLEQAAHTRRFGDVKLSNYVNSIELESTKQFSAVVFTLTPALHYVAYRGTDSTLIGWKEDFDMATKVQVPSQIEAAEYLTGCMKNLEGSFYIGGHSKGGNLAVYAAANQTEEMEKRIASVWNFDGPGFAANPDMVEKARNISWKTYTFVPESSIIGMLLRSTKNYFVVASDDELFFQHDAYKWHIEPCHFVQIDDVSRFSQVTDNTIQNVLMELSDEQIEEIVNIIFNAANDAGLHTVQDLNANKIKFAAAVANEYANAGKETQANVKKVLDIIIESLTQKR